MLSRFAKTLLLVCVASWAAGALHYLHERAESHDDGDSSEAAVLLAQSSVHSSDHRESHHHDHDHCPTCQLLAHLTASVVSVSPPVCTHLFCEFAMALTGGQPPAAAARSALPIRGPPAASILSA
jgi:hypothetical protein